MSPSYPECNVMGTVASHLKQNIKFFLQKDAVCQQNKPCTGVNCTWSGGGRLEVDLHHCDEVYYHIFANAPSKGITNKEKTLKQGSTLRLYDDGRKGKFSLHVYTLSRTNDIITTKVGWELCLFGACSPVGKGPIIDRRICVNMESCPDFNASATHYQSCHATSGPTGPHFEPEKRPTTEAPEPGSLDAHKGGKHKDDSSLSTAAIIGICAAGLIATLVVIGTVVYWKKYHHRSRLRAAYYNDISMHDPLYEDFGPEVA